MKTRIFALVSTAGVALTLGAAGLALADKAPAKTKGAPPARNGAGNSGKPQGGSGGGRQGGGQPGNGQALVSGAITALDAVAGTITVTASNGTATVIAITAATRLIGHQTIAAADVAVGDRLEVTGVPLTMLAVKVTDNKLPAPTDAAGGGSSSDTSGGKPGEGPARELRVTGVVTVAAPLTIRVADAFDVVLTTTPDTTFRGVLPLTFANLAVGQTVNARTTSTNGTVTADVVDVAPAS